MSRVGQVWQFKWILFPEQIMLVVDESADESMVRLLDLLTGNVSNLEADELDAPDSSPEMTRLA